ncbi:DUF2087 domain-containing protein [Bacillus coahuilensis]|uniref:DUF2087 domain-containing protein n=1 Tax=Bacillus coahuilensis TaxID=408580 RepID=UPI0009EB15CE
MIFLLKDGKLKYIPSQLKKKLIILEHIVEGLDSTRTYNEIELNEVILTYHEDFCTIRREFIVQGFMDRSSSEYTIRDKKDWKRWDELG